MFSPRAAEIQETVHLRDALVYTDRCLFGARERKDKIVGTIAEPPKRHTIAGVSENSLRKSMGIVCTSQSLIDELLRTPCLRSSQNFPSTHSGE
jgi:hypothetical protein